MGRSGTIAVLVGGMLAALVVAGSAERSRAYRGHANDADAANLVAAYPTAAGTRLDDCATCHRAGEVRDARGRTALRNACAYCHLVPFPDATVVSGAPADFAATLNPFGAAYRDAGRSVAALGAIAGRDADGDGFANNAEIAASRQPGDAASRPGQATAPTIVLSDAEIAGMPSHRQLLLLNSHTQRFDEYASVSGVRMRDLLAAAGVDLSHATGITCIAPDGYAVDFDLERVRAPYPPGVFAAGLAPRGEADTTRGFVRYPAAAELPAGLADGVLPDSLWLMVARRQDGHDLAMSRLEPVTGRQEGDGPYRLIAPQEVPSRPDRGTRFSPSGHADGYDFDPAKDHNAGRCIRGLVAIRVNPMPAGYEEYDWKNGGWALIERGEIIVYGAGVSGTSVR
jgi:hypothetical protein